MSEEYIICLTSYPARFKNLPKVLDSLWAQDMKPGKIVLTLARKEYAVFLQMYPEGLNCDVLVVENNVRVYKKFLYAMEKYAINPFNPFVCVDDDFIYANCAIRMLFNLWHSDLHPVSGNTYWHNGLKCHCGALSLVCPHMFNGWRKYERYFGGLESSDMFYTMLAAENHYTYTSAGDLLEHYATPVEGKETYTKRGQVQRTYLQFAKILGWI